MKTTMIDLLRILMWLDQYSGRATADRLKTWLWAELDRVVVEEE